MTTLEAVWLGGGIMAAAIILTVAVYAWLTR